ncbi:UBAP1-MVB12-associated (UMA)-domain containing protein 1-like [Entelurus aequoreus]|uniref:UBAP1-MVB12-associated (UMA)-domain containing protein 1-like n=1 Tax=Entelurus aequoreus TaxID=161455 RepID=UPI002B1DD08B|nr:UBAP1-MVB12-associated (UMA)-domain containing protein 1-like [Entelurus aequoreus]XP_061885367.1 UBAP1-MVB12-associated (UMA)-domain containing protein 1-like [Entelurus aequoreus]XP_061885368.1 UBAP1-MVB12-associated (UMA)-domain containing protein 1-like [Entelurus aequoreus]
MLSFLGLRKDSKKQTEKEADGGFVIIGETVEEQRRKMQSMKITQPSTNVIVLPPKSCPDHVSTSTAPLTPAVSSVVEAASPVPDLLGDVPFTLSPGVQAMQTALSYIPDVLLSKDMNSKLAYFHYDFTLEKAVLQNA